MYHINLNNIMLRFKCENKRIKVIFTTVCDEKITFINELF